VPARWATRLRSAAASSPPGPCPTYSGQYAASGTLTKGNYDKVGGLKGLIEGRRPTCAAQPGAGAGRAAALRSTRRAAGRAWRIDLCAGAGPDQRSGRNDPAGLRRGQALARSNRNCSLGSTAGVSSSARARRRAALAYALTEPRTPPLLLVGRGRERWSGSPHPPTPDPIPPPRWGGESMQRGHS